MARSGWKESGARMCLGRCSGGIDAASPTSRRAGWLAALALCAAAALAQDQPVIRVDVNLVRVVATVKDQTGQLVGALDKKDFEIYDNGIRQEVAVLERDTDQPLSVVLLVDNSGSTNKELKYEMDSAGRFLKAFLGEGNPRDSVALYTFNWQVERRNYFTRNAASLEKSLKAMKGEAGTALYDAIYLAARDLEGREGRRVMVIVTDGGDTTSVKDLKQALAAAQFADAVIYPVVVVPITNDAGRNVGGENALTFMANGTGGRTFLPSVGAELDTAFSEIVRELRTQYVLGFYPKAVPLTKDRFHRLEVKVSRRELRVSARNGYYGEAEGSSGSPGARVTALPEGKRRQQN